MAIIALVTSPFVRTTEQISLGVLVSVNNLIICKEDLTRVAVEIAPDLLKTRTI